MIDKLLDIVTDRALDGAEMDECAVSTCGDDDVEIVVLEPLDPIDHDVTYVPLCDEHTEWAKERNELAEAVTKELREARARVGEKYEDDVRRVNLPPDGELDEAVEIDIASEARKRVEDVLGITS